MEITIYGLHGRTKAFYLNKINEFCEVLKLDKFETHTIRFSFTKSKLGKTSLGIFYTPVHGKKSHYVSKKLYVYIHPFLGRKEKLETILHEMIHVKQYLEKQFRLCGNMKKTCAYWKKENMGILEKIEYKKRPWGKAASRSTSYYAKKLMSKKLRKKLII